MKKQCSRCKLEISEKEDNYLQIIEFISGKKKSEAFMHRSCWKEFISEKSAQKKMISKTMGILDRFQERFA